MARRIPATIQPLTKMAMNAIKAIFNVLHQSLEVTSGFGSMGAEITTTLAGNAGLLISSLTLNTPFSLNFLTFEKAVWPKLIQLLSQTYLSSQCKLLVSYNSLGNGMIAVGGDPLFTSPFINISFSFWQSNTPSTFSNLMLVMLPPLHPDRPTTMFFYLIVKLILGFAKLTKPSRMLIPLWIQYENLSVFYYSGFGFPRPRENASPLFLMFAACVLGFPLHYFDRIQGAPQAQSTKFPGLPSLSSNILPTFMLSNSLFCPPLYRTIQLISVQIPNSFVL